MCGITSCGIVIPFACCGTICLEGVHDAVASRDVEVVVSSNVFWRVLV